MIAMIDAGDPGAGALERTVRDCKWPQALQTRSFKPMSDCFEYNLWQCEFTGLAKMIRTLFPVALEQNLISETWLVTSRDATRLLEAMNERK